MKAKTVSYLTKTGLKQAFTNRLMSAASIISVAACLLILGLFFLFSVNMNAFAEKLQTEWVIVARVEDTADEAQTAEIRAALERIPNIGDISYESKEQALENYKASLGEESFYLEGIEEDNPLRASFTVTLESLDLADETADTIGAISGVAKVERNSEVAKVLLNFSKSVRMGSFWVMIGLALLAVFIIQNTIRLTVVNRKTEIRIMKYVGATNAFVRLPFLVEGVAIGLVGALFAYLLIALGYWKLCDWFTASAFAGILDLKSLKDICLIMAAMFAGFGIIIGAGGSVLSMRKYLRA